ncbi:MAG TPA: ABC transporter permease [Bryobacteraceae bacterium]|nr:ABC transporter permease [Bryobacteraceae bacterium]
MGHILNDLRYALRTFRKSPVFVTVAVFSLALGIGANTAIFTLIDQVLLRLLPVKDPRQLVLLWGRGQHYGSNNGANKISYPMYEDFRDKNQVFSGMFCRDDMTFSLNFDGKTELISGELVSGTYFPVLGVHAAIGRVFDPSDDRSDGGAPYAVLSYRYWISRFAGDPRVIGRKLVLNGYPFTVVGVSQAGFDGTDPTQSPQIRVPVMMKLQVDQIGFYDLRNRRNRWVNAYGRMKPGITVEQAKAGLQPLMHQMLEMEVQEKDFAHAAEETKQAFLRMWIDLLPAANGRSGLRKQVSSPLLVLMAIVALVLLIACANVANLLIARATARQKEIAVRLAMGASRGQIVSQLMVESLLLSLTGGAAGLLLAVWIDRTLLSFMPPGPTNTLTISATPDWRIMLFALGTSLLTGIIFGLVPAVQATRPDLAPTLKDQVGAVTSTASIGLRKALVVAQVMLSLLLLVGAGLFIRSLQNLKNLDPGFTTKNLLTFAIDPPLNGYKPERSREIFRQLYENLNGLAGVESAAFAIMPVMEGNEWDSSVSIDTYKAKPNEDLDPHMNFVSPGYFKTMGVPILQGRDFRPSDAGKDAPKVCIINEKFARKYFPEGRALGHRMGMGGDPGTKTDIEVVGIFRDMKYEGMKDDVPIEMVRPYEQMEFTLGMSVYLRTARDPEQTFAAARRTVQQVDATLPVVDMKTLEKQVDNSLVTERLVASLSSAFGMLATLLASIGLYGVMAYTVARRTREIGIRMALGAATGNVVWLVMKEVLVLVGIGIGLGLAASWGLTRFVKAQLYGIAPNDLMTIVLATIGIAFVAIAAGYVPAMRATRVDPIQALRFE